MRAEAPYYRPTVVVETYGSTWAFDEHNLVYRRAPKVEGPRPPGPNGEDWGGPGAAPGMQDFMWHPYSSFEIDQFYNDHGPHLRITADGVIIVQAPGAEIIARYHA